MSSKEINPILLLIGHAIKNKRIQAIRCIVCDHKEADIALGINRNNNNNVDNVNLVCGFCGYVMQFESRFLLN